MAVNETARKNHDELFPGHVSTLQPLAPAFPDLTDARADPEIPEVRRRLRPGREPARAGGRDEPLAGNNLIKLADIKRQLDARDRETVNAYSKDAQVMGIRNALSYIGDSLARTAAVAATA